MAPSVRSSGDQVLVQIADNAFADAARRSGDWLLCKAGCSQCCIGVFPIGQLDVVRLRRGMVALEANSPERAAAVRKRVQESVQRLSADFPGDPQTGLLYEDEGSEKRFEDFANEEPCPALDPATGRCEVYEHRPMICRTFGPPLKTEEEDFAVCDLCFQGATAAQIAACEVTPDPDDLESPLEKEAEQVTGRSGRTIVAFGLHVDWLSEVEK